MVGAGICLLGLMRGVRALHATLRFNLNCRRSGTFTRLAHGGPSPICLVDGHGALLGITGVFRPWLIMSRTTMAALSPDELDVALRHEAAHVAFRDNLLRLFLLLAPRATLAGATRRMLNSAWARFTEWAADDWAVGNDPRSSLTLAAALVQMARIGAGPAPVPLSSSLLEGDRELSARVARLLRGHTFAAPDASDSHAEAGKLPWFLLTGGSGVLLSALAGALVLHPATLHSIHFLLEKIIR